MSNYPVHWLTLDEFCRRTGYTREAVLMKRKNGVWPDGSITKNTGGRVHVNVAEYDRWVSTGQVRCRAA